jgi:cytochrome c-type biogenesis protein CcmF
MLGEVGFLLSGLSLFTTLYGVFATGWGLHKRAPRWIQSAKHATYAVPTLLGTALLLLLGAFISDDFEIRYVAEHSSRALPLYLKVSAIWGGQEGSLLLWVFLQGLFAALAVAFPTEKARPLIPWATIFLNIVTAFFLTVMVVLSNPFLKLPETPPNGLGLNPLLRHPGMIFHPPTLYVGYVGLAVPFAFAMAALITRRIPGWTEAAHTWTLIAWLGLGLGLLLGMRWAYDVLGWGGYWGWDPVENAGLLPWLTTTALLHSAVMQEERRGFRYWTLILAILSFVLVLFGTFATRSGMIQSVHAYVRSNLGYYFLAAIGITTIGSLALLYTRQQTLNSVPTGSGLLSREGMFFLTLTLLLTLTFSVLVGSLLPTLTQSLTGQRFEAGPQWFDRVTGPQFAALIAVMGICPLLGRTTALLKKLRKRVWLPAIGAIGIPAVLIVMGFNQVVSIFGLTLSGLAGLTTAAQWITEASRLRRSRETNLLTAGWTLLRRQRRKYGGYLVHIGIILMAVGVVGSRVHAFERDVSLPREEPIAIRDYALIYESLDQETEVDHLDISAVISVKRNGKSIAKLSPSLKYYESHEQSVRVPALRAGVREDLYLVLGGWSDNADTISVKVMVNPLINFLWLGGLVFLTGGGFALWPRSTRGTFNILAAVIGVSLLLGAGWAMWGIPHGTLRSESGRPGIGQPAPEVDDLTLLDGSSVALQEFQGSVTVIIFWNSQCPVCKQAMPNLQTLWEEYEGRDVVVLGIAVGNTQAEARRVIEELGTSYPIALDPTGSIAARYGITGVPETFVVDRAGRIAYVDVGAVNMNTLTSRVDPLLKQP